MENNNDESIKNNNDSNKINTDSDLNVENTKSNDNDSSALDLLDYNDYSIDKIENRFLDIEKVFVNKINDLQEQNEKLVNHCQSFFASHQKLLNLAERQEYLNRLVRRTKEQIRFANKGLAANLLDPIDWLENTISNASDDIKNDNWFKGLNFILNGLMNALSESNVVPIPIKPGDKFETATSEAIEVVENNDIESGRIVEIKQKGYLLHDKVLRHAKVTIAK